MASARRYELDDIRIARIGDGPTRPGVVLAIDEHHLLAIDLSEERCAEGHIDVDVVVALLFAVVGIEGGVDATTPLPTLWDGSFC